MSAKDLNAKSASPEEKPPGDAAGTAAANSATSQNASAAKASAASEGAKAGMEKAKTGFEGLSRNAKIGIAAGIIAVVVLIVFLVRGTGPSDGTIKESIDSEYDTSYSASYFDLDQPLTIDSVKVTKNERKSMTSEERQILQYFGVSGINEYYEVTAQVTSSNDEFEKTEDITANFVKYQGQWESLGGWSTTNTSYTPKAGPDKDAIAANISSILYQADSNGSGSVSLSSLYQDGKVKITDNKVDGTSAKVTIHLTSSSSIATSEGDITANFSFDSGHWNLDSAKASDDALKTSYDSLVGTWTGTFQTTNGYNGDCFGGKANPCTVTITSVDPDTNMVNGTVTFLAHKHQYLDNDADSADGDTVVTDLPFNGVLDAGYSSLGISTQMVASYTSPESSDGYYKIDFGFGTSDDPNAVKIGIETIYEYTDSWGWSEQSYVTDTYTLTKSDES